MPDDNGYNQVETPVAELVRERYGGEIYESYPLGQHIVAARLFVVGAQRSNIRGWKPL